VIALKVKELAKQNGVDVDVRQTKVSEALGLSEEADLIVATTQVSSRISIPVINALPLLTGVGTQPVMEAILAELKKE
jgi:PTS system galactitol-specific IIB component